MVRGAGGSRMSTGTYSGRLWQVPIAQSGQQAGHAIPGGGGRVERCKIPEGWEEDGEREASQAPTAAGWTGGIMRAAGDWVGSQWMSVDGDGGDDDSHAPGG